MLSLPAPWDAWDWPVTLRPPSRRVRVVTLPRGSDGRRVDARTSKQGQQYQLQKLLLVVPKVEGSQAFGRCGDVTWFSTGRSRWDEANQLHVTPRMPWFFLEESAFTPCPQIPEALVAKCGVFFGRHSSHERIARGDYCGVPNPHAMQRCRWPFGPQTRNHWTNVFSLCSTRPVQ